MPIKVNSGLPAAKILEKENVFCMTEERAVAQDIRPLRIAILNLMPNKEATETQIMRMIANSPLQAEVVLLHTASYDSKNTSQSHLENFYMTFSEVLNEGKKFDGLVITGAPVEQMEFEDVAYWEEIKSIMDWAGENVFSTLYICWAAQAGLYYHFGVKKYPVDSKVFGIFWHSVLDKTNLLAKGFDQYFLAPHSRHTEVRREDIEQAEGLTIVAESQDAGVYIAASNDYRHVFVTGHGEYDAESLHNEYVRDLNKGLKIEMPKNYYPKDDPGRKPVLTWRAHASLLYMNWLNYCVYQSTPFDINKIGK